MFDYSLKLFRYPNNYAAMDFGNPVNWTYDPLTMVEVDPCRNADGSLELDCDRSELFVSIERNPFKGSEVGAKFPHLYDPKTYMNEQLFPDHYY